MQGSSLKGEGARERFAPSAAVVLPMVGGSPESARASVRLPMPPSGCLLSLQPSALSLRAFTLVELAATVLVLGAVTLVLVGLLRHVRTEAKRELAVRGLVALDSALTAYAQAHQAYPPGTADGDASGCLAALCSDGAAQPAIKALPKNWRKGCEQAGAWLDPWGTPLRYVTAAHDAARVAANAGKPFFECAGNDRDFGDDDPARTADNILTDEPLH